MSKKKQIIRHPSAVAAVVRNIAVGLGYGVLAVIVFMVCWFEFAGGKEGYDLLLIRRFGARHTYYGIFYRKAFEVWEIQRNESGTFQSLRLFPR